MILTKVEPTRVMVGGEEVSLLFTMRAAAEMERELGTPYPQILDELFQRHEPDEPEPPMMTWERQAKVIACLMRAGGHEADAEAVMDLHVHSFSSLAQGAVKEILFKTPQGSKKK
ncbi:MAG: hypothetical protein IJ461_10600 [Clostridia bacterium]|nr:hypothetical protein [Clostridia bacterium]